MTVLEDTVLGAEKFLASWLHNTPVFPASSSFRTGVHQSKEFTMALLTTTLAASTGTAAGFSLVYLLAGGGLLGAALIFVVAKML
jgi:hypothetical protein